MRYLTPYYFLKKCWIHKANESQVSTIKMYSHKKIKWYTALYWKFRQIVHNSLPEAVQDRDECSMSCAQKLTKRHWKKKKKYKDIIVKQMFAHNKLHSLTAFRTWKTNTPYRTPCRNQCATPSITLHCTPSKIFVNACTHRRLTVCANVHCVEWHPRERATEKRNGLYDGWLKPGRRQSSHAVY